MPTIRLLTRPAARRAVRGAAAVIAACSLLTARGLALEIPDPFAALDETARFLLTPHVPGGDVVEGLLETLPSPDEVPLALELARISKKPPMDIARLRRAGKPWREIAHVLRVPAPALLVPDLPDRLVPPGLSEAYAVLRRATRDGVWLADALTDNAILQLSALRLAVVDLHLDPGEIFSRVHSGIRLPLAIHAVAKAHADRGIGPPPWAPAKGYRSHKADKHKHDRDKGHDGKHGKGRGRH
ncbi:MAG: hypothetical protein HYV63_02285 [Candidatus Schekmanbacteria bacterium]|nr:hypothetical protein [Candidatus Schekmanbacteria bacterium]